MGLYCPILFFHNKISTKNVNFQSLDQTTLLRPDKH
jgi:hypothetical protein